MQQAYELKNYLMSEGCSEVGFCSLEHYKKGTLLEEYKGSEKLNYGISIIIKLSDAVLDGIEDKPTHAYFHHYRTVNSHIDNLILKAGLFIEKCGYRYIPVAASQSINGYRGLFQHKTAARLSGLGGIGRSGLFISHKYGSRVRLGTIITDMPLPVPNPFQGDVCGNCRICVGACPAGAITSEPFSIVNPNDTLDRHACSNYMKDNFKHIGRGVVCGICMINCPKR